MYLLGIAWRLSSPSPSLRWAHLSTSTNSVQLTTNTRPRCERLRGTSSRQMMFCATSGVRPWINSWAIQLSRGIKLRLSSQASKFLISNIKTLWCFKSQWIWWTKTDLPPIRTFLQSPKTFASPHPQSRTPTARRQSPLASLNQPPAPQQYTPPLTVSGSPSQWTRTRSSRPSTTTSWSRTKEIKWRRCNRSKPWGDKASSRMCYKQTSMISRRWYRIRNNLLNSWIHSLGELMLMT